MHSIPALPEILALSGGLRWCKVCGLALTQQQLSESLFLRFTKTNYHFALESQIRKKGL